MREQLGLTALLQWFRDERRRTAGTERPRRLDSDLAAVQVVTVHGSKGLQYPVCYLPFLFQTFVRPVEVARFHAGHDRALDVTGSGPHWAASAAAHQREDAGEELRDLYVALTRAQGQVVAWWAPTKNTADGGLHRLLLGRQPGVAVVPDQQPVRDDDYVTRVLGLLEELGGPTREESVVAEAAVTARTPDDAPLSLRRFGRAVDAEWRRTSYSGLIRVEEEQAGPAGPATPGVVSEPEEPGLQDEATLAGDALAAAATSAEAPVRSTRSPRSPTPSRPWSRRWPTCPPEPASAAWSTRCSSTPTPTRPTCWPSCAGTPSSSCAGGPSTCPPTTSPRPSCRCTARRSARCSRG